MPNWTSLGATPDAVGLLLHEAAVRLQDVGWLQGTFRDPESGAMDIVQALADVVGLDLTLACRKDNRLAVGSCVLLGAALERATDRSGARYLTHWNDDPARTLGEVVALLTGPP